LANTDPIGHRVKETSNEQVCARFGHCRAVRIESGAGTGTGNVALWSQRPDATAQHGRATGSSLPALERPAQRVPPSTELPLFDVRTMEARYPTRGQPKFGPRCSDIRAMLW